jgi:indolepyruvate decarboxylase
MAGSPRAWACSPHRLASGMGPRQMAIIAERINNAKSVVATVARRKTEHLVLYGVGELSALNGVMGAKAERSLVFHIVGMPSYQHQRMHKIAHHTLGDGVFGNFVDLSAGAACCHAVINPENCVVEMERVIAEARRNHQPAYIAVPSDYALSPVVPADVKPIMPRSNEVALRKAMAIIAERINNAKSVVATVSAGMIRMCGKRAGRPSISC